MRQQMRVEGCLRFAGGRSPAEALRLRLGGENFAGDQIAQFRAIARDGNFHVGFGRQK